MKRIVSIAPDERKNLKSKVDFVGRQLIADLLDYRYGTLSDKLAGRMPISQEECSRISSACDNRTNGKKQEGL